MKIVSLDNSILESEASIQTIDGVTGLVLESRGGTRGAPNERNRDYMEALDTLIERLKSAGIRGLRIYLVSSEALRLWSMQDRILQLDGSQEIRLSGVTKTIRGRICRAQQLKKRDAKSKGGNPTKRILLVADLDPLRWQNMALGGSDRYTISEIDLDSVAGDFDPLNIASAKDRVMRSVAERRGRASFRRKLLAAYRGRCAVTGCDIPELLEAAHIVPYAGKKTNHVQNGLLLRSDIHTLFDLGMLGITDCFKVIITTSLAQSQEYGSLHEASISLPLRGANWPSTKALSLRPLPARQVGRRINHDKYISA